MARRGKRPPARAVSASKERTLDVIVAFGCVAVVSYLGFGFFSVPRSMAWIALGVLSAIIAGLACRRWLLAAAAAGAGVALGAVTGMLSSPAITQAAGAPWTLWLAAGLGAALAAGTAALLVQRPDLERWVAWAGVACVIAGVWATGWVYATQSVGGSMPPAQFFDTRPTMAADTFDEQIFVLTVRKMQSGSGYYAAMASTLDELNSARPGVVNDLSRPTSFRLPTLYWLLAHTPGGGRAWVALMLTLVSGGVVAAWSIGARFVAPAAALAGTSLAGEFMARFVDAQLPDTEVWAGILVLVAASIAVKSLSVKRNALAWAAGAAAVALAATLTRELAVGVLAIGLAATLSGERVRSWGLWIPWVAAFGVAALAYAGHMAAVAAVVRTLPHPVVGAASHYLDVSGGGFSAASGLLARYAWWFAPVAWVVLAAGAVGSVMAPPDWPRRVMLGGVAAGGLVAMTFLHPWAPPGYPVTGLWGAVVLPTIVACAPLALWRVPGLTRLPRGSRASG